MPHLNIASGPSSYDLWSDFVCLGHASQWAWAEFVWAGFVIVRVHLLPSKDLRISLYSILITSGTQ